MTQTGRRDDDFQVYVWKSTDFGETWKDISGEIPVGPVNVIREDPINPDILYLGTDASVYISKDKGASWNVLGPEIGLYSTISGTSAITSVGITTVITSYSIHYTKLYEKPGRAYR